MTPRDIEDIQKRAAERSRSDVGKNSRRGAAPLAPIRHSQKGFFLAQTFDAALKDDRASMEHPMSSLLKVPDLNIRVYEHNGNSLTITPSANGLATIGDKDILLFTISTLIEPRIEALRRAVKIRLHTREPLVYWNRGVSGAEYDGLVKTFERLAGTRIKTDITTDKKRHRQGLGLIESWSIVERITSNRISCIELTLSKWLYDAVIANEVLTYRASIFVFAKTSSDGSASWSANIADYKQNLSFGWIRYSRNRARCAL